MNTALYSQTESSASFHKWLFVTTLSVSLSVFVTALAAFSFALSISRTEILLCLTTSFFSSLTQIAVIRTALPIKDTHRFFGSLLGNIIGWAVSFLVVFPLIQLVVQRFDVSLDSEKLHVAVLLGMLGGGALGLFPGLFSSFVYWWLMRSSYHNAKRVLVNNVIGWCLGMGFGSTTILILLAVVTISF